MNCKLERLVRLFRQMCCRCENCGGKLDSRNVPNGDAELLGLSILCECIQCKHRQYI